MKIRRVGVLLLLIAAFADICLGQSFLSKYPTLTRGNLKEFVNDWQTYSDSIGRHSVIQDSVLAKIIERESAEYERTDNGYCVVPETIVVERNFTEIDSTHFKSLFSFFYDINDFKGVKYEVDSITPILPAKGLYLTPNIDYLLSKFAGGLRKGDELTKINKDNVKRLRKFIIADYGHWGGYWWFCNYPIIEEIFYADNVIAVFRRLSWCTGDTVIYEYTLRKKAGMSEKRSWGDG